MLATWELYGVLGRLPSYLIAPSAIAATTAGMLLSGELWRHTADSLLRVAGGYALGSVCGIGLGLLAGIARPVERFYEPIISLTYPVPKIVVLPVLIAWLGAGDASKIAVITAAVFYPTFINSLYGAKAVNRLHVWSARNMGASAAQTFFKVVLPSALPQVLAGLRIGLALAFIVVVASEMQNSRSGLGSSHHHRRGQSALRSDVCGHRRHRRDRLPRRPPAGRPAPSRAGGPDARPGRPA